MLGRHSRKDHPSGRLANVARVDRFLSEFCMRITFLEIDDASRQIGSSGAILGHPIRALVAAARLAAAAGEPLQAGDIIMAGGAMAEEALASGPHGRVSVGALGFAEFRVGRRSQI